MNVLNRDDVQRALDNIVGKTSWNVDAIIDEAERFAMENGYTDRDFAYEDGDAEYYFECVKPETYVYDEDGELDCGNDDSEYWLWLIRDKKTGSDIYRKCSPQYEEKFKGTRKASANKAQCVKADEKKEVFVYKAMDINGNGVYKIFYDDGTYEILKGSRTYERGFGDYDRFVSMETLRHATAPPKGKARRASARKERAAQDGSNCKIKGTEASNTRANKQIDAAADTDDDDSYLFSDWRMSDYIEEGDTIYSDGQDYYVTEIKDVKNVDGYELAVVEVSTGANIGVNVPKKLVGNQDYYYFVLLNGDVEWGVCDTYEEAKEWYDGVEDGYYEEDYEYDETDAEDVESSVRRKSGARRAARKPVNADLKIISDLSDYQPWSGAVETYERIKDAGKLDDFEAEMELIYPEGLTMTQLNDILWFEPEWVYEMLGMNEDNDYDDEYDEYED